MASKRKKKNKKLSPTLLLFCVIISVSVLIFAITLQGLLHPVTTEEVNHSEDEFISELLPYAKKLQEQYGILPSIILGQAILESDWGKSELSQNYYNLFGMKASASDKKIGLHTKEYEKGECIEITADFKVYDSWESSMTDHTLLFVNGVSWNPTLYQPVLQAKNYKEAAQALQTAGYATDPTYASKIIEVIETYQLSQYDQ